MCLGCLCSVQMPFFSPAFELLLLSEYTAAIKSCSQTTQFLRFLHVVLSLGMIHTHFK